MEENCLCNAYGETNFVLVETDCDFCNLLVEESLYNLFGEIVSFYNVSMPEIVNFDNLYAEEIVNFYSL